MSAEQSGENIVENFREPGRVVEQSCHRTEQVSEKVTGSGLRGDVQNNSAEINLQAENIERQRAEVEEQPTCSRCFRAFIAPHLEDSGGVPRAAKRIVGGFCYLLADSAAQPRVAQHLVVALLSVRAKLSGRDAVAFGEISREMTGIV